MRMELKHTMITTFLRRRLFLTLEVFQVCGTLPLYVLDRQRKEEERRIVKEPREHSYTILI